MAVCIIRCALAWMQLDAIEGADMLASPVMALALEALESPEACDDACELVTAALEAFTDPGAVEVGIPPPTHTHPFMVYRRMYLRASRFLSLSPSSQPVQKKFSAGRVVERIMADEDGTCIPTL